jgi:chromosome partitioning protein
VITVGALKGGVGKSTLSVFLACVYASRGLRVLYVCADPLSQTGRDWWNQADDGGHPMPYDLEHWADTAVGDQIRRRALGHYDVVIVDTGGESDSILRSAVEVADFVLLATSPRQLDVRRLLATFQSAYAAAKAVGRAIDVAVVFTLVDQRRVAYNAEMRDRIEGKLPVLESTMSHLSLYQNAFGKVPDGDDLTEVTAIAKEIGA